MDMTELEVTDDLYIPEGAIAEAQAMAAASAGAAGTIFLTNGSTCGIEAMLGYTRARGKRIIMPRAVHKSAISACALYGLEPIWVDSTADDGGAPWTDKGEIIAAIAANPGAAGVFLTRPDYYGRACALDKIVAAAHRHGMLVMVDEAHGAHYNWLQPDGLSGNDASLPAGAMRLGADMCVQSAHKTLCALTGGAYLNYSESIDGEALLRRVELTQSSSPSFLIMASLDYARAEMDARGGEMLRELCARCDEVYRAAAETDGLSCAFEDFGAMLDRTRITIDVSGRGITGHEALRALSGRGIDIEMADIRRIVMITSIADSDADFDALIAGLKALPRGNTRFGPRTRARFSRGEAVMTIREATLARSAFLPIEKAIGRAAARMICVYPPGIPSVVPGEIITPEAAEYVCAAEKAGASVYGLRGGAAACVE